MVNEILHYPNARIVVNDGDEIRVEYIRKVMYNAKTLKRLCGWVYDTLLIGIVENGTVHFRNEQGTHKFSHCVYNVELGITRQYLQLLEIRHNPRQLKLW